MTANLADPHFAFVWPSYGLLILVLVGLAALAFGRLTHWARRAKAGDDEPGRSA
ncbi:MAG: hypothetical protein KJS97_10050 [Alphaproteobacteria bacterium]|nr:hypothetical protein [Alphaproteobacteria bacterium]